MSEFFFPENECGIANKVPKSDFDFVVSCDILPPPPPLSDCVSPIIVPDPIIPCPTFNVQAEISTSLEPDDNCRTTENNENDPTNPSEPGGEPGGETDPENPGIPPAPEVEIVTEWTFEGTTVPSTGAGTASTHATATVGFVPGVAGLAWETFGYPAQGTNSGGAGVEFMASTEDFPGPISVTFSQRAASAASRWASVDYTLDGGSTWVTNFWSNGGGLSPHDTFNSFTVDFSSVTGAADNPGFGFRIVSIFSPQAFDQNNVRVPYAAYAAYMRADTGAVYSPGESGASGDYSPAGTWAFDNVTVISGGSSGTGGPGGGGNGEGENNNNSGCGQTCEETGIKFTIDPVPRCTPDGACTFDVDLDIHIKIPTPPCPEINIIDFIVETFVEREGCYPGDSRFKVTPRHTPTTCDEYGRCIFDIELEIFIPIPRVPCPEINIRTFEIGSGYRDACEKDSRFIITTRHRPGGCRSQDECVFDIDLEIWIPLPPINCPEINITKFVVTSSYEICTRGRNRFEITTRHIPGSCEESPQCVFDIELEIDIPIPVPPCPQIDGKIIAVTRYSDVPSRGRTRMVITRTVNTNCETGNNCTFFIDIFIDIPIPRVCCPIIIPQSQISVGYNFPTFAILRVIDQSECFIGRPIRPVCRFILQLEISIGLPLPPCPKFVPEVELTMLAPNATPYMFFAPVVVLPPRLVLIGGTVVLEPCEIRIKLRMGLPRACDIQIIKGEDEFRTVGCDVEDSHVELMVERLDFCRYKVWLYGWIPPKCAPTGGSSPVEYCDCDCSSGSGGATGPTDGGSEGDPDGTYDWGPGGPDAMPLRAAILDEGTDYIPDSGPEDYLPDSGATGPTESGACPPGTISIEVQKGAGDNGADKLIPKLTIPRAQCIKGGTVTITPEGMGSGTVEITGTCDDQQIKINIDLNVTDCGGGPSGPSGPETGPGGEEFMPFMANTAAANLVATKEQIRQTLLDGLKLQDDGSPADPEFYQQIANLVKTVIAK